ncbi:ArsA family ATPase [Haloarchaeobius iranensis]|uniref:Arsenite efflux ATP-binding protein ArsA n=1 Tax=Haloarchaeobius iranensis TaxID=996166 RepID=A0A1G9T7J9_9EURY|nr:ArsA family ATPase [Haloarchaeobius iranensis]SDM43729.1 arsenite efflux ATP-binding protein ArsA [Haloarchaeobius iranensis]
MSDISVDPVDEVEDADDAPDPQDESQHPADGIAVDAVDENLDEATTDALDGVDAPEYVLYGGKGGVGKTTMAAATGLASAADGTRTLVVSTDPAHSLSDTFETDIPSEPTRIREDIPLFAAEIDPEQAMEEGAALFGGAGGDGTDPFADDSGTGGAGPMAGDDAMGQGPMGGLGDMLGDDGEDPMSSMLGGAMPGADEAAAMQLFLEYLDDPRFDRVVVDTAPTGHTLRLLELPEVMDTMVGRIAKMRERLSGLMGGLGGMFGGDDGADQQSPDLDELADRIERLRAVLQDPAQTDFRIVMVPEEMSVFESRRLRAQLEEFEIPVGTVVVNRVMEDLADVTDSVEADEFVKPNLADCEFCQRRWDVQQSALAEAQELFRGTDVRRVPLFADEVRGERMLRIVAACLD